MEEISGEENFVNTINTPHDVVDEDETVAEEYLAKESEEIFDADMLCDIELKEGEESVLFDNPSLVCENGSVVQTEVNSKGFTQVDCIIAPSTDITTNIPHNFLVTMRHLTTKFVCNYCNYSTAHKPSIDRHMVSIHNDNETNHLDDSNCYLCDKKSSSRCAFERHYALNHPTNDKLYSCHYCKYKVNYKHIIKLHIFMKHLSKLDLDNKDCFHCNLCNFKCSYKYELNRHLKQKHHLIDNYLCTICKQRFVSSAALKKHKLEIHSDHQIFSCNMCEYTAMKRNNLFVHVSGCHKKDIVNLITSSMCDLT